MTSLAMKPFARSLSVRATRPRVLSYLSASSPSVVDPYRAAAARDRGLAAAIVGSWPLASRPYRSFD
jgi:hypothetical protein